MSVELGRVKWRFDQPEVLLKLEYLSVVVSPIVAGIFNLFSQPLCLLSIQTVPIDADSVVATDRIFRCEV